MLRATLLLLASIAILVALSPTARAEEDETRKAFARLFHHLGTEDVDTEEAFAKLYKRLDEWPREEEAKKYTDEVLGKELAQLDNPRYLKKASAYQMQFTSLSTAIYRGDMDKIKWLVWSGADVNKADEILNKTPLHEASARGQLYAAKLLINRGAIVDAVDHWGNTPLYEACEKGHLDIAELLLNYGADKNKAGFLRRTPLQRVPKEKMEEFRKLFDRY